MSDDPKPKDSERDFSKEIGQIGFLPGSPAPLQHNSAQSPPSRVDSENLPKESNSDLILRLLLTTKGGLLITSALALFFLGQVFNLGILGVQSFVVAFLIFYLSREIKQQISLPQEERDEVQSFWIKVIFLPTAFFSFLEIKFLWQQQAASALTQEISGNPNAWAECQRFTPALFADTLSAGYYAPSQDRNKAVIQYIYCNHWGKFFFSDPNSIEDIQTLWSVGTVIHEAVHASGELNEAITQCLTLRAYPQVLKRYGVSESKAKEYATRYSQGSLRMPAQYLNGRCDQHPLVERLPQIFGTKTEN